MSDHTTPLRVLPPHRLRSLLALTVALLALAAPLSAQAQDQRVLGADGALGLALDRSPALRAVILEHERASQLVLGEEARYGFVLGIDGGLTVGETPSLTIGRVAQSYNEQISLGADITRNFEWGMQVELRAAGARQFRRAVFIPTMPTPIEVGPGYSFDVTLTVTQPLLRNAWDRTGLASLRTARVDRDRVAAERDRGASELVRDVYAAYWELWYAHAALEVDRQARDLAVSQLDDAQAREELGTVAQADVLSFATRRAAMEEAIAVAEGAVHRGQLELGRLIGGGPAAITPSDVAPGIPVTRDAASVEIALERSPEMAEAHARVRAAEEGARLAGSALEPRLDLQGQIGVHGMGYDDAIAAFEQFGRFAAVTGALNLVFEMPLDDTQHRTELERASLAIEVANRQLEITRDRVRTETMRLLDASAIARRRLALAEETVRIATELASAEQQRYELGARTSITVLEAQSQLRSAQLRALRATVDLAVADIQLAHVEGELLPLAAGALASDD